MVTFKAELNIAILKLIFAGRKTDLLSLLLKCVFNVPTVMTYEYNTPFTVQAWYKALNFFKLQNFFVSVITNSLQKLYLFCFAKDFIALESKNKL